MDSIIQIICYMALPLIFAITIHEAAHAYVAKCCGDQTAFLLGRVSFNPVRHIDPFGTIILPLLMIIMSRALHGPPFIFGYAKPVPVDWRNLKNHRRDKALVAIAGPASNILMALIWVWVAWCAAQVLSQPMHYPAMLQPAAKFLSITGYFGVILNVLLAVLNMLPIPPLDGSRVVASFLPRSMVYAYERLEPYGMYILLALLFLGGFKYILGPPVTWLSSVIFNLVPR
jgi:Zn-dependent protease